MRIMALRRMTVRQAAARTGLSGSTLRELDRRGIFRARRDYSGRRIYSERDIRRLRELAGLEPDDQP